MLIVCLNLQIAIAQCESKIYKPSLETGMMIIGVMDDGSKIYVARVISVTGTDFDGQFVHSNSLYSFKNMKTDSDELSEATVTKNTRGKYPPGTIFKFFIYATAASDCSLENHFADDNTPCISTFNDGKTFLGNVEQQGENYIITYWHSNSIYTFDKDWKIIKVSGGSYPVGQNVKVAYAQKVDF